nr:hypothetical protein Itr_chr02CG17520 [Ipomoea trifida]
MDSWDELLQVKVRMCIIFYPLLFVDVAVRLHQRLRPHLSPKRRGHASARSAKDAPWPPMAEDAPRPQAPKTRLGPKRQGRGSATHGQGHASATNGRGRVSAPSAKDAPRPPMAEVAPWPQTQPPGHRVEKKRGGNKAKSIE